jgi:hypothetical protein
MKILRVRRGFTTNSSGANEWLPDGGSRPRPPIPAASADAPQQPVLTTVQPWDGNPPSACAPTTNASAVGLVSLVVAGAFLVVPVARLIRKRKKKETEADDDGA